MTRISPREVFLRARARGVADTSRRAVRRLYGTLDARMGLQSLNFPLNDGDVSSSAGMGRIPRKTHGDVMEIGWLCTPPIPGAGGHTTFFRMVRGMEDRGHRCTILVYNRGEGEMDRYRSIIRNCWPDLTADVREVPAVLDGFDACVASSWETAHVLAARLSSKEAPTPYYFIQDYEPYFHPRGSLYALAEDSYRFGFTHLALGPMVAGVLRREVCAESEIIPYGSDLTLYRRENTGKRSGIVFFAKPEAERRGYDMGRLALKEFHRLHPDQKIHIYGSRVRGWEIPLTQHGRLTPAQLNELYNRTIASLALSFTNITLVAAELLAAGNIPVLNDHEYSRAVMNNPEAVWAEPSPSSLAKALSTVVMDGDSRARSERAAAHRGPSWTLAQERLAFIISGDSDHLPVGHETTSLLRESR